MEQAIVSFPIDAEINAKFEQVCQKLDLTLTEAFTMFMKKVSGENRIPFEEEVHPFYSQENMAVLSRRIADIKSGKAKMTERELIRVDEE
ncbi:MAG: type II toxin-antitoxin system RelB/DinJ family antitoxin [Oscillospiraceae bacterium]|nr:type II toxin-antitoxin system RelB/DinJ family antitoxin [Oscillospiraceae bacterium]